MNNIINFPTICYFCKGKIINYICENYDKTQECWQHTKIKSGFIDIYLNSKYYIIYNQKIQHLCVYDASSPDGKYLFEITNINITDFSNDFILSILENKVFL